MGKRILLVKQDTIGRLFQPRAQREAVILRIAGPEVPEDAKLLNFAYFAEICCFGLVMESPEWSDLVIGGANPAEQINGIKILPNAAGHFHALTFQNPAIACPACAIEGYDGLPRMETSQVLAMLGG